MEEGRFTGRGNNMSKGMKRRKNMFRKKKLTFRIYRGVVLQKEGALRGEMIFAREKDPRGGRGIGTRKWMLEREIVVIQ